VTPLVSRLEDILEPLGFKREKRPFTPHLTLGRVRSNRNSSELIDAVRQSSEIFRTDFYGKPCGIIRKYFETDGRGIFGTSVVSIFLKRGVELKFSNTTLSRAKMARR